MLRDWLRRFLGVAPQGYICPNRACGSPDVLALGVITRAVPGSPWQQRRVGCVVQCVKCGERYCITLEGIYTPSSDPPKLTAEQSFRRNLSDGVESRTIDDLMRDLATPSEPA